MTSALKNLARVVVRLAPKERVLLAEHLLNSLDESELERAWIDEAKRRREEVHAGKVKPVRAEAVYRRIDRLLGK